jgi:acetyl-CoA carboxylase biotin carboxyl carrier protein
MPLSARDVVDILKTVNSLGYRRFRLEQGDVTLEVDSDGGGAAPQARVPVAMPAPSVASAAPAAPVSTAVSGTTATPTVATAPREGLVAVTAPMTGTFYRAPSPSAPPFVEIGSKVDADQTVCLVDVMKLFTSIPAGVAGTVAEIVAANEAPVQAGQTLMWIDPA